MLIHDLSGYDIYYLLLNPHLLQDYRVKNYISVKCEYIQLRKFCSAFSLIINN